MAEFSELVKNFAKVRSYMRDFYIYGFKVRKDYTYKSGRTYDNERRRVESWLNEWVRWDYSQQGKRIFLVLKASLTDANPLYRAWKSKSFTDNDLVLHFYLLDALADGQSYTAEGLNQRLSHRLNVILDTQTIRRKANEYVQLGLLWAQKEGRALYYRLQPITVLDLSAAVLEGLMFFQEASALGVIGSFILDAAGRKNEYFTFKHHFMVHTLDDDILLTLLSAIAQKRWVALDDDRTTLIPLKIMRSEQTGRAYLTAYLLKQKWFRHFRLDHIDVITLGEKVAHYENYQQLLAQKLPHCWGVSFGNADELETVEMVIAIDEKRESYVLARLKREGRHGQIEALTEGQYMYRHQVYDANEMLPWLKTFIGRIVAFRCSNKNVERKMFRDFERLYGMYLRKEE